MSRFRKAERKQARLRLALTGPSGSGKTYSALLIAKGIGGKIAVIDTERSSASLYSDLVDFDTLALDAPFSPEAYIEAIKEAEAAGYNILVIDSITHEWNGSGGILEIHDVVTRTKARGNSYVAWADVTPRHNGFIDAILQADMHVICTMRSKTDFVLTEEKGKQVPKKVGLAPIQREGFDYEMTVVLDIDRDSHLALTSKDRTRLFTDDPVKLSEKDGVRLREWLISGKSVEDQITEDVERLTSSLQGAAMEGTEAFTRVWQANRSPARDRIGADAKLMKNLQAACKKADGVTDDTSQQQEQQEQQERAEA